MWPGLDYVKNYDFHANDIKEYFGSLKNVALYYDGSDFIIESDGLIKVKPGCDDDNYGVMDTISDVFVFHPEADASGVDPVGDLGKTTVEWRASYLGEDAGSGLYLGKSQI